jgi:integrase
MADETYLHRKGLTYWYIRAIPEKYRGWMKEPDTGKANFRRNLKTSDLVKAQLGRLTANAEFETAMALAKRLATDETYGEREFRRWQADAFRSQAEREADPDMTSFILHEAQRVAREDIEPRLGEQAALAFLARAEGRKGVEIDEHLERWIAEEKVTLGVSDKRRYVVGSLANWRATLRVGDITRETARAFVEEVLAKDRAPGTVNGYLGVLTTYWNWMMAQDYIPEGQEPWSKFRRKKGRRKPGEQERAFTAEEIRALLSPGPERPDLRDAMLMAALTGARIEEIATLKASDVDLKGMTLHLPGTKTDAAERTIPLHPSLKATFERRVESKDKAVWVFDELPERSADDPKGRGSAISKAFTRHRRSAGVDAKVDGKRRALTNFHSFRRWFVTEAERAGAPPHVIMSIVGHKRPGMTLGVYSGGPDLEAQMRKVVEAVKLPAGVL